ncbi:MAG TPA: hypothetical protein VJV23_13895 [Candidatus Polarisedimenticolia bacterium]|nr:hypothetical protein [Candidatus Polarisedimenticolia bacterium]
MLRKILTSKTFWAAALPLALCGAVFAGEDCHGKDGKAAHAHGEKGKHCMLAKNVRKTATMTDDGAVVVLEGKSDEAVAHIKEHLGNHEKGADCPGCPMGMEGVSANVKLTDKGGEITLKGASPDAVKKVQEWASKPAGACCSGHEKPAA